VSKHHLLTCNCGRPFARIDGNKLRIESRHGGETHVNYLALADVVKLLTEILRCGSLALQSGEEAPPSPSGWPPFMQY